MSEGGRSQHLDPEGVRLAQETVARMERGEYDDERLAEAIRAASEPFPAACAQCAQRRADDRAVPPARTVAQAEFDREQQQRKDAAAVAVPEPCPHDPMSYIGSTGRCRFL